MNAGPLVLTLGSTGISVTTIFRFEGAPKNNECIFRFAISGSSANNIILKRSGTSGRIEFVLPTGTYLSPVTFLQNETIRLAVQYNPSIGVTGSILFWINGALLETVLLSGKATDRLVDETYIGRSSDSTAPCTTMRLYSLQIYNRILSSKEIWDHTAGNRLDLPMIWPNVSSLIVCDLGSTRNGTQCIPCPAGTYKPSRGNQECTNCPANATCSSTNVTSIACAGGTCGGDIDASPTTIEIGDFVVASSFTEAEESYTSATTLDSVMPTSTVGLSEASWDTMSPTMAVTNSVAEETQSLADEYHSSVQETLESDKETSTILSTTTSLMISSGPTRSILATTLRKQLATVIAFAGVAALMVCLTIATLIYIRLELRLKPRPRTK